MILLGFSFFGNSTSFIKGGRGDGDKGVKGAKTHIGVERERVSQSQNEGYGSIPSKIVRRG